MTNNKSKINISGICPNAYWNQFYKEPSAKTYITELRKKNQLLNR
ncbi:MAG: hypothetical protein ACQERX_00410 [Bacillota bacterium]